MKPKIYIETSIISYLTSRSSRDVVVAGRQQLTQIWWNERRHHFDLYISPIVLREISAGDVSAAAERQRVVASIPILELRKDVFDLTKQFLAKGSIPKNAADDAFHIALATIYGIDYLMTWNCTHIANASIRKVLEKLIHNAGYFCPIICTPDELMGELAL